MSEPVQDRPTITEYEEDYELLEEIARRETALGQLVILREAVIDLLVETGNSVSTVVLAVKRLLGKVKEQ